MDIPALNPSADSQLVVEALVPDDSMPDQFNLLAWTVLNLYDGSLKPISGTHQLPLYEPPVSRTIPV